MHVVAMKLGRRQQFDNECTQGLIKHKSGAERSSYLTAGL
jgi:hypothetical protein